MTREEIKIYAKDRLKTAKRALKKILSLEQGDPDRSTSSSYHLQKAKEYYKKEKRVAKKILRNVGLGSKR